MNRRISYLAWLILVEASLLPLPLVGASNPRETFPIKTLTVLLDHVPEGVSDEKEERFVEGIKAALSSLPCEIVYLSDHGKLEQYLADKPEFVFNFPLSRNGYYGEGRYLELLALFARYATPHDNAEQEGYRLSVDKHITNQVAAQNHIPAPREYVLSPEDIVEGRFEGISPEIFPAFLKLQAEMSSRAVTPASKMENFTDLQEKFARIQAKAPKDLRWLLQKKDLAPHHPQPCGWLLQEYLLQLK
jgi:hypothetical protein